MFQFLNQIIIFILILEEKDWYNIDVISCAAHNQKVYKVEYEKLKEINYNKIKAIIECAVENNIDNLILGPLVANDPKLVSKTFKKILIDENYYKYFENVHFAIFTTLNEKKNQMNLLRLLKNILKTITYNDNFILI